MQPEFLDCCKKFGIEPTKFILTVSIAEQTVSLFKQNKFLKKFPCSTSRFGIGQKEGSNCTPLGLHRIAEKIGAGEPAGTVFKGRKSSATRRSRNLRSQNHHSHRARVANVC